MNVLAELRKKGYDISSMQKNKQLSQTTVDKLRRKETNIRIDTLDIICKLLDAQPSNIIEYKPDKKTREKGNAIL